MDEFICIHLPKNTDQWKRHHMAEDLNLQLP